MNIPSIAVILHGAHWPAGDPGSLWRERLSRLTGRVVDVVLARDEPTRLRGAGRVLADAIGQTLAPQLLVVEVTAPPDDDTVRALLDALAASPAPALATVGPADADGPAASWAETLLAARDQVTPPTFAAHPLWAVDRDALIEVGGIDGALWSYGLVEDLEARFAASGRHTVRLPRPTITTAGDAYPYAAPLDAFLRWHARLRLDALHASAEDVGPRLSRTLVSLLASAWRATGVRALGVSFGGDWGRASLATRLRTRLGGPPPEALWPADEAATVVPLAALHAFTLDLPELARLRDARGLGALPRQLHAAGPPDAPADPGLPLARPRVSVIVVNWNGSTHLEPCFSSLLASDYPTDLLELICVDNGSTDDSVDLLRAQFPTVRIVELPDNRGFTGGNAAGVAEARGDVFLFVNNDMRFEPTMVSRLIDAIGPHAACVGARVMDWQGRRIDFVRGTSSFEARGFQEHYGEPFVPGTSLAESFFPNGGAFAVTRRAYEEAGGFDPALFAYYDDVDLGWRLRLAGHGIRTVPDAVAYHRHGSTVRTQPHAHKRYLMARNALFTTLRNYDDTTLPHVLAAILALAGLRVAQDVTWLATPIHRSLRPWLDRTRSLPVPGHVMGGARPWPAPERVIARLPMPELAAIGAALEDLPRLLDVHADQQRRRRVPDEAVLPFLGRPFEELDGRRSYRAAQKSLIEILGLRARLGIRPHVVLITHEALRANMSGPAIRVLEMARALSRTARVTVLAPAPLEVRDQRVALVPFDPTRPTALRAQAESADAIVVQGFALTTYPFLTALVCPIVADLYCPFTIEHLEQTRAGGQAGPSLDAEASSILAVQNGQLQQADFFLCASERQRDFWIGALHTAGRVNPRTVARDADLRALIDVVPFGLPSEPVADAAERARAARRARGLPPRVLKGAHPAIRDTDKVLLWGGSLLDWQDPETLIAAVARLARSRDDVKLFFMGVKHPNPQVTPMAVVARARALAESLGVADTHVIFNDWVPYDERSLYLTEADLGVSTHHTHLETRYAFRTRMLDYLWARLPIVCSSGDYFGDLVRDRGLGRAVPPGDVDGLAEAITEMLDDVAAQREARAGLAEVGETMTWARVVEPLQRWCLDPRFAADREREVVAFRAHLGESFKASRWLKRTALRLGVKEGDVEALKRWGPVRAGMSLRNAMAIGRARRKARRSP